MTKGLRESENIQRRMPVARVLEKKVCGRIFVVDSKFWLIAPV